MNARLPPHTVSALPTRAGSRLKPNTLNTKWWCWFKLKKKGIFIYSLSSTQLVGRLTKRKRTKNGYIIGYTNQIRALYILQDSFRLLQHITTYIICNNPSFFRPLIDQRTHPLRVCVCVICFSVLPISHNTNTLLQQQQQLLLLLLLLLTVPTQS